MTLLLSLALYADDSNLHCLIIEEKLRENQISQEIKALYSPFLQIRAIEINPVLSMEQSLKKGDKIIINLSEDKIYNASITKFRKSKHGSNIIVARVDNAYYSRFMLITNDDSSIGIFEIIDEDFEVYFFNTSPFDSRTYIIQYDPSEDNKSICLSNDPGFLFDTTKPENQKSPFIYREKSKDDDTYHLEINIYPPGSGSLYKLNNNNGLYTPVLCQNGYDNYHLPGDILDFLVTPKRIPDSAGGSESIDYNEYNFF